MASGSQASKDNPQKCLQKKKKRALKNLTKKNAKNASAVWQHFEKQRHNIVVTNENGEDIIVGHEMKAHCKYCKSVITCTSSYGTSTLRKHILEHCDGYPGSVKNMQTGQKQLSIDVEGEDVVVSHWTQENCLQAAVEMIVIDELPFSTIEKPGFKRFCRVVVPKWNVPCRKVVVKSFLSMYNAKKEELKDKLMNHCISLTTDTWTSVQNINYMVLTAHFIDDGWNMHKRILNFCVIPNHQGRTIGKILERCLHEWSIKKVLTISVDNAASNKVALDYVKKIFNNGDRQIVLNGKFLHVRCLAHIVNLIVKSGLRCLEKSVASIRNAVRYVRSSSSRLESFKECVKKDGLESKKVCVLDVPTRWNSTFIMLDTAVELKPAFDRLADEDDSKFKGYFDEEEDDWEDNDVEIGRKCTKRIGPPNDNDWVRAANFVKFLKVFFDVTLSISATNKPTAHKAFHEIVTIKCEIDDLHSMELTEKSTETEKVLFDMARLMRKKYLSYFNSIDDMNQLFLVGLVLDPRFKLRYFGRVIGRMLGYDDAAVKTKSGNLKELIIKLTDLYAPSISSQCSNTKNESTESDIGTSNRYSSTKISGKKALMIEDWEKDLEDDTIVISHEVDRYLLDPIEKCNSDFDILKWWRLNGSKYPNLQLVAKDVLAIQVSTVASESCFSTGKRVIDPHRSSLTPRSVEALICLQNWLKSASVTNLEYTPTPEEIEFIENTEKELDEEEKAEREEREKIEKEKEKAIVEKKNKVAKTSKNADAGIASRMIIN